MRGYFSPEWTSSPSCQTWRAPIGHHSRKRRLHYTTPTAPSSPPWHVSPGLLTTVFPKDPNGISRCCYAIDLDGARLEALAAETVPDAEVSFQVELKVEHIHRVAGLLTDDGEHVGFYFLRACLWLGCDSL